MNFIFIAPNFPENYRHFCDRLHRNGVTVLGIGDAPYDSLSDTVKNALTEYYKVDSLEDYSQVYRAVAFLAFRYGRIGWIESNNEYWLELDAKLRRDFNVTTGVMPDELALWKSKAAMKPVYRSAGIPSARQHHVSTIEAARGFLDEIGGYPVFAKPNVGVGDFVGLEVNMRPAGGFTPDMINFSHSTDAYQIWADMVSTGTSSGRKNGPDRWCVFASRKDRFTHVHTHDEILSRYDGKIVMCQRMPDIFSGAMGNQMYVALLDTEDEVRDYVEFILDEQARIVIPSLYK